MREDYRSISAGLASAVKAPVCSHLMSGKAQAAPLCPTPACQPVLFPGVVSACVCLSDFCGQHSNDVHKEDKVELKRTNRQENYSWALNKVGCVKYVQTDAKVFLCIESSSIHPIRCRQNQTWNSSIIFSTVIWRLSRKMWFWDGAKAACSAACRCLVHLCCAAASDSLTVMFVAARTLTLDDTQTQTHTVSTLILSLHLHFNFLL